MTALLLVLALRGCARTGGDLDVDASRATEVAR